MKSALFWTIDHILGYINERIWNSWYDLWNYLYHDNLPFNPSDCIFCKRWMNQLGPL